MATSHTASPPPPRAPAPAPQERATRIAHGNTGRQALLQGSPQLAKICGTIAADEGRHEAFYTSVMGEVFR